MTFGYHGKILHIDLTTQHAWLETPDETFWRIYGGGGLLATYYLLRETPPGLDAFAPDNLLILTSSVVAGHPYAGLARFTAAAKSPLTGGIGETRAEGPFGKALKGSGADEIIVRGVAATPTTVLVENGVVTFHAAADLWGKTVGQTVDALETRFGNTIHTAVIGPAGEKLVRFASIVSDRTYQAARHGLGAVMGSKQLKAIVIRGEQLPPVADPATCDALTADYAAKMRANSLTRWQLEPPGFSAWVHLHGIDAALCVHNYRDSVFAAADNYRPEAFMHYYQADGVCPGCPNNCIKLFTPGGNGQVDARAGGIHQEITGTLGPNCGIADLATIFQANLLCNELGMDPTSLGFTLSMAMECVEQGLLAAPLRFGDGAALLQMIQAIADRQGVGDTLAEGSKRAAAQIGGDATKYALHVKGLEMVCFEPRTQTNLALGYATAPIGPRYDICEHDWDFDTTVGWDHTLDSSRTLGIVQRIPMHYQGVDKVRNFKALMTIWSAADALDFCIFAVAPTRVLTLEQMAQMLAAVTGWRTSSYEIMRFGERRLQLMRVYNLREGLTAADDTLPDRFFDDPIPSGQWAGHRLNREQFTAAIRTYYRMMGWDDAGIPSYETLLDHHLEWAAVG
jgi:aldehyde:ferredoxin oxidoreductase